MMILRSVCRTADFVQQAVEQITGIPVRETYIYSFHLQREIMM